MALLTSRAQQCGGTVRRFSSGRSAASVSSWALLALFQCLLLFHALSPFLAYASPGDEAPTYQICLAGCIRTGCVKASVVDLGCNTACPRDRHKVPFILWLYGWSCEADCRYQCMEAVEHGRFANSITLGHAPSSEFTEFKYYGHWPMARILGLENFFSATSSLGLCLVHVVGLTYFFINLEEMTGFMSKLVQSPVLVGTELARKLKTWAPDGCLPVMRRSRHVDYPYTWLWTLLGLLCINSAVWGFAYHAHHTAFTHMADAISKDAVIFYGALAVIVRSAGLTSPMSLYGGGIVTCQLFTFYLYWILFNQEYGSKPSSVAIGLSVAQAVLWITWAQVVRHPGRWLLLVFIVLHLGLDAADFMLDFQPVLELVDFHAIWHALMVPIMLLLYMFIDSDVIWAIEENGR